MPTESIDDRLRAAGLPTLPRPVWLEIDEAALANNLAVFRELAGPDVEMNAVVKADAYGHGLKTVGRLFEAAGADRLCVASLDEALALREAGVTIPVLVLFSIPPALAPLAARNRIEITASDVRTVHATLESWNARASDGELVVHLEVETGLTRGGVKAQHVAGAVRHLTGTPGVRVAAIWTHLATPESQTATSGQISEFERAATLIGDAGLPMPPRHVGATGGVLTGGAPAFDGVRIGLGLYGILPLDLPIAAEIQSFADRLRPALALKCRALRIEKFPAGTRVSYGGLWTAERESVIATLPVGYADSIPRPAPWGSAIVQGRKVPLVGSVAMDAVMADVTEIPGVNLQDEFVLLGEQGGVTISAEELARGRNTIPWEVATSMSHRLPRVYHAASVLKGLRTLNAETPVSTTENEKGERNG